MTRTCSCCHQSLPHTREYFRFYQGRYWSGQCLDCLARKRREREERDPEDEGQPRKGKGCFRCEGLPWRRPEDGTPCKCGQFYEAELPVSLAYGAAWTTDRTTYPSSGGLE